MDKAYIKKILETQYNIKIIHLKKNEESTDGNVYEIDNKYILKVYIDINHVHLLVNLHNYLNWNNIKVPSIIKNINGDYYVSSNQIYFVMYSFVRGNKIETLNNQKIEQIAKYLKCLHSLKKGKLQLESVPFKVEAERQSILHFDITKSNIFEKCNELVFIDFDDAKYGPAICDVSIAITNLFISKAKGADIQGMNYFLNVYYGEDENLRNRELPFIKEVAISWLNYILNGHDFDCSNKLGLENKIAHWRNINIVNLKSSFLKYYLK